MRIQTFGDSICTFGWARALAHERDILARWGATADELIRQAERADADVAVVSVGVNDALQGRSVEDDLRAAVAVLAERCRLVVLLPAQVSGPRQVLADIKRLRLRYPLVRRRLRRQAALRDELAREYGVVVPDVRLRWRHWQPDGVHPGRRGELVIGRAVRAVITR